MKTILYTILLFSVFACNTSPVAKPDNLLDEDVMVDILYDVAILQAIDGHVPERLISNNIQTNTFIYNKYKIDSTTYYQNHKYYASNVRKYKKMYTELISRIEDKKIELKSPSDTKSKSTSETKDVYIPEVD